MLMGDKAEADNQETLENKMARETKDLKRWMYKSYQEKVGWLVRRYKKKAHFKQSISYCWLLNGVE